MRWLEEFVEGKHRTVLEVLALAGIVVEEEIELPRGVSLVPSSSLPQSALTDLLAPDPMHVIGDPMRHMFVPTPSAALVIENEGGVELLEKFPNSIDDPPHVSNQMLLHRTAQCLTLLPEICESCRHEVQALERVIALLDYTEKRVAEVTFRESVEGVCCMNCVPEE